MATGRPWRRGPWPWLALGLGFAALLLWQFRAGSPPGPPTTGTLEPDTVPPRVAGVPPNLAPETREGLSPAEALTQATGVFGRVEDASGAPIAGARVRLLVAPIGTGALALPTPIEGTETTTDAEGRFLVGPAPASGVSLTLEARAPGRASAQRHGVLRGTNVVLVLGDEASLVVTVRDARRAPIAGARVVAVATNTRAVATTGDEGEARFEGLSPGAVEVHARAAGHGPAEARLALARPGDGARCTIGLGPALPLSVRVLEAVGDEPAAGVRVTLVHGRTFEQEEVGRTDRAGRLRIESAGGPGESLLLLARRDAGDEATTALNLPSLGAKGEAEAVLRLPATTGEDLAGVVVDLEERPVAGATVMFSNAGGIPSMARTATSDASGRFTLRAPPDHGPGQRFRIGAISPVDGIGVAEVRPGTPGRVSLQGAGRVEGTITDEKGTPLEGARIILRTEVAADAAIASFLNDPRVRAIRSAVSDAQGAWACGSAPAGAFLVEASWGLDASMELARGNLSPGGHEHLALSLPTGLVLEGQVTSTAGPPVVGAALRAWPAHGGGGENTPSGVSVAQGRFALRGVSAGRWTVEASAAGYAAGQTEEILVPSQQALLRLVPLGSIAGVVEDPQGAPYASPFEVVVVRLPDAATAALAGPDEGEPRTFSGGDGTFRFEGLPAGPRRVDVRTASGLRLEHAVEVRVEDGQETPVPHLRLRQGAALHGTVRSVPGGQPVAGAGVEILRGDSAPDGAPDSRYAVTSDAQGRWSVGGLSEDTWRVIARTGRGGFAEARLALAWGQDSECALEVPGSGRLVVKVTDAKGAPVAGAGVALESEKGTSLLGVGVGNTDAEGRWTSDAVPSGRVKVRVGPGMTPGTGDEGFVDLRPGGEALFESTFRRKTAGGASR